MNLSKAEIAALRDIENVHGMVADPAVRSRLKKLGYIEAMPWFRRYRHMPYVITAAGLDALKSAETPSPCIACGGSGRVGPFFPGGLSTICGNCTPTGTKLASHGQQSNSVVSQKSGNLQDNDAINTSGTGGHE